MILRLVSEVKHMAVFLHILVDFVQLDVVHDRVCIHRTQFRIISRLLDVAVVEVVHQYLRHIENRKPNKKSACSEE